MFDNLIVLYLSSKIVYVSDTKNATASSGSGTFLDTSSSAVEPWDKEECRQIITELFDSKVVHSIFSCPELLCSSVSATEANRLKPKKFIHSWLNRENWWLCYVEGEGMFCLACKKHNMKHPQNRREVFSGTPGIRFKQDALSTHRNSSLHSAALESEILQKMSCFHQEVKKKTETENSVLEKAFGTAYFLMKEFIPNRKFTPLLSLRVMMILQSVSYDD